MNITPQLLPVGPYGHVSLTGTKGRGLTYQKKVGKVLAREAANLGWELLDHWWLCSAVKSGEVWRQPDFVLLAPSGCGIVFESKLTWVDCTFQINQYVGLLGKMGISAFGITICRNLTPFSPAPITSFDAIYPGATWHVFL